MKELIEYILICLVVSLALMGNAMMWLALYDEIKERIKKHDKH